MKTLWLKVLYGLIALAVVSVLAFVTFQPVQVLPRIMPAPGLNLVDQDGRPLTTETLRGQVVLYTFAYAGCGEACAGVQAALRTLQERLAGLDTGEVPVRLVTISFDPEHDTPAVLRDFAAQAGADPDRWLFATGEPQLLKSAIGAGFEVYYAPAAAGGFEFDPALALVDGWGLLRAEYRTGAPDVERLARDILLVTTEARRSTGLARYAYEAAHLFACYPR